MDLEQPISIDSLEAASSLVGPLIEFALGTCEMTPVQRARLLKLKQGTPIAAVLGIERRHRDALFVRGCRLFQAGKYSEAYQQLLFLYMLQPADARVAYALGLTMQALGAIAEAARLFLLYIALDATNPEGHLRRAECLLGLHKLEDAGEHASAAARLAQNDRQRAHAEALIALIQRANTGTLLQDTLASSTLAPENMDSLS